MYAFHVATYYSYTLSFGYTCMKSCLLNEGASYLPLNSIA